MKGYITDDATGSANCVRHMMLSCTVGKGFFVKNGASLVSASSTIVLSLSYPWDSMGREQPERVGRANGIKKRGGSDFRDDGGAHSYMSRPPLAMEASSRRPADIAHSNMATRVRTFERSNGEHQWREVSFLEFGTRFA